MGAPDRTECVTCKATGSKYKCPACRLPYCSVACCREHKGASPICTRVILNLGHPRTSSLTRPPLSFAEKSCASKKKPEEKPPTEEPSAATEPPAPRPKRSFEEDAEDEDGARLRRKHLLAVASSEEIRECLRDERLVNTVARIDSTARAEQALDAACEDPAFREFTEKILNKLEEASK